MQTTEEQANIYICAVWSVPLLPLSRKIEKGLVYLIIIFIFVVWFEGKSQTLFSSEMYLCGKQ